MEDRIKVKFSELERKFIEKAVTDGEYSTRVAVIRTAVRKLMKGKKVSPVPEVDVELSPVISIRINTKAERDKIARWMATTGLSQNQAARKMLFERYSDDTGGPTKADSSKLIMMLGIVKTAQKTNGRLTPQEHIDLLDTFSEYLTELYEDNK
ncbi:MAG: hypothetical protein ABJH04_08230 [Cyclobacteriaceae bacterium]